MSIGCIARSEDREEGKEVMAEYCGELYEAKILKIDDNDAEIEKFIAQCLKTMTTSKNSNSSQGDNVGVHSTDEQQITSTKRRSETPTTGAKRGKAQINEEPPAAKREFLARFNRTGILQPISLSQSEQPIIRSQPEQPGFVNQQSITAPLSSVYGDAIALVDNLNVQERQEIQLLIQPEESYTEMLYEDPSNSYDWTTTCSSCSKLQEQVSWLKAENLKLTDKVSKYKAMATSSTGSLNETRPSAASYCRPKAGVVSEEDAQKYKMICLGGSVYIHADELNRLDLKRPGNAIRQLIGFVFPESERLNRKWPSKKRVEEGATDIFDSNVVKTIVAWVFAEQTGSRLTYAKIWNAGERKISSAQTKAKKKALLATN
ncbi:PREDICTED: uncharacterized protein LOC106808283 [Priapulus caudatus]|uniref:Uncharacterized protein LOC106808283 n=1 Tax=Priapulus caudatus TaxID=37621 RepID=A0ABM1E2J6_PRICU|nr:PREDICTED: uncharacterized protein LOC106808283 [Priapulus caudatus]